MIAFRPIAFLLALLAIIAMTVQGHRSSSPPSLLSSLNASVNANALQSSKLSPLMRSVLKIRGGDDEEAEEEEESDDEAEDEAPSSASASAIDYAAILQKVMDVTKEVAEVTKEKVLPVVMKYSKKGAVTAKKTSITIYQALQRAISAAMAGEETEEGDEEDSDDEEEEKVTTAMDKVIVISKKTVACIKRMVKAAMTVPEAEASVEDDDDVDEAEDETAEDKKGEPKDVDCDAVTTDFGSYLAEAYGVDDQRSSGKTKGPVILDGSLQDALQTARQQARMLLVFIPSERPEGERGFFGRKGNAESEEMDRVAIESLLSAEVAKAANKKARKKAPEFGSFAIWGGKAGSREASSAIKQLKVKESKGEKRPVMCVVYPAVASAEKIVPKVLAQHHCNPPMKAESMASWMNTLRKRHGKQYESMQTDLKELKLYQERKEGYIDSVQSDKERKKKEAQEEAERKAAEEKEAARKAEICARRQELQDGLPEDVKKGNNVKKIALRFSDGRSAQRGFASDQPLQVVFNWVDAMFEIERETVVLTTLNGKQTFSWESDETKGNQTLEDAGLKKNTAFRVTEA